MTARKSLLIVLAVTLPVVALQFFAPYDLRESDQGKQAQYILDVVQNGNWLAPGSLGEAATKPPLYTWIGALISLAFGRIDELTIRIPTALSAIGLVIVTWDIARRLASVRVATAAAVAVATSHHFILLCGLVRTDGLLALLLTAQILVYVRTMDRGEMPPRDVALCALLAAAACMTKGPAGLLSCGVVAVHLAFLDRRRDIGRAAGVPALTGVVVLGAWFLLARDTRPDVQHVMVDEEVGRFAGGQGFPNPAYYLIHMPLRLAPWVLLLVPAAVMAWRALRDRRTLALPPVVSLCLPWLAVHFAAFSFISHQRPDLIYLAEPAALLLVALLIDHPFPAWAPRATAVVLVLAAAALFTPMADRLLTPAAPAFVAPGGAALFLAGAAATLFVSRRDAAVACFAGLAAAGLADVFLDAMGESAEEAQESYREFGQTARAEAQRRGVPLVAVGFDKPAALFNLHISVRPDPAEGHEFGSRRVLVVSTPVNRKVVERALGRCDVVAKHLGDRFTHPTLLLLAPR